MPVIRLLHSGLTAGIPPMKKNLNPQKRGDIKGWSMAATRNNMRFLRSIRPSSLSGDAYAFTLTVRNCPPSSDEWHKLRRAFIERLRRRGLIRLHWVTEWQRRGVPHLHGIVFFPPNLLSHPSDIYIQWIRVASKYGAGVRGQNVKQATDVVGWFQYVSKHAARGISHYQRSPENIPALWREKTGRVWGYVGEWVKDASIDFSLDNRAYYCFRRLVRSWRVSHARSNPIKIKGLGGLTVPDVKRIKEARTMLRCNDIYLSRSLGISEWINDDIGLAFMDYLQGMGHNVVQ